MWKEGLKSIDGHRQQSHIWLFLFGTMDRDDFEERRTTDSFPEKEGRPICRRHRFTPSHGCLFICRFEKEAAPEKLRS